MSGSHLSIVVVEPSAMVSRGLAAIVEESGSQVTVTRMEDPAVLIRQAGRHPVDVAIVNPVCVLKDPGLLDSLRDALPGVTRLSLVYAYYDSALLALFDATLSIGDAPHEIMSTIRKTAGRPEGLPAVASEALTDRETEVLKLLASGFSAKEIADRLNISAHTVVSHRKNISQKAGIKSVAGLTLYAVVQGLVATEDFPSRTSAP